MLRGEAAGVLRLHLGKCTFEAEASVLHQVRADECSTSRKALDAVHEDRALLGVTLQRTVDEGCGIPDRPEPLPGYLLRLVHRVLKRQKHVPYAVRLVGWRRLLGLHRAIDNVCDAIALKQRQIRRIGHGAKVQAWSDLVSAQTVHGGDESLVAKTIELRDALLVLATCRSEVLWRLVRPVQRGAQPCRVLPLVIVEWHRVATVACIPVDGPEV
mmetsp:Transcript_25430/g.70855  ORF Transcript_25430/g.70855 Transcript_25430/m.70855 type:complete len:214 (+) Transcript_25430:152-793(+)